MTEIRSLTNDLKFGLNNEESLAKLIQGFCGKYGENKFINTKELYNDVYCAWDWEGDINGTHIEMKSRRNKKHQYPTTILPCHKIQKTDKKQLFIFHFTDESCYIEYDADLFSTFSTQMVSTYRLGIKDYPKNHFCIPVSKLLKISV